MERITWEDIKRLILRNGTLVPPNLHVYTIGNYQINYHALQDKICLCKDNVEVAVIKRHVYYHTAELEEVANKALRLNRGITSVIDYYAKLYFGYIESENERKKQEEEKLEKLQSFIAK